MFENNVTFFGEHLANDGVYSYFEQWAPYENKVYWRPEADNPGLQWIAVDLGQDVNVFRIIFFISYRVKTERADKTSAIEGRVGSSYLPTAGTPEDLTSKNTLCGRYETYTDFHINLWLTCPNQYITGRYVTIQQTAPSTKPFEIGEINIQDRPTPVPGSVLEGEFETAFQELKLTFFDK